MARPNHAKPREGTPRTRVWLIVALLAAGLLAIPATAQDAPTTCDYSQSHLHNGWGWDGEAEESCAPARGNGVEPNLATPGSVAHSGVEHRDIEHDEVAPTPVEQSPVQPTVPDIAEAVHPTTTVSPAAELMVGTCDYSKSHLFDGYGWDEINGVSCEPLLTTSTTEYIAPEPGSPEDMCNYSKSHVHDGWGWDEINGVTCAPMATRIAKAAAKKKAQAAEQAAESAVEDAVEDAAQSAVENEVEEVLPAQTRPPSGSAPVHPDDWDGDGVTDPLDNFPFDPDRQ